ncbi:type II toxin-antitoxin system PemK/MazF family toxin [Chloroflexota bacterium]
MAATIETSIFMQKALFNQVESLAQHLNISPNHLCEIAIEEFIANYQSQALLDELNQPAQTATPTGGEQLVINQGDVYWVQLADLNGAEPGIPHPHVVIQDNLFNHSRINTVVTCALTSNIKRTSLPGSVLLEAGEANLPRPSVVETSKVSTVDKALLGEIIGSLSEARINQILAGMRFLQTSFFDR